MKNNHKKAVAVLCGTMMAASLSLTACGGASTAESVDLREMPLDTILEKAKAEGQINSVGMPDDWANWRGSWAAVSEKYGLTHEDTDMSSAEELSTFETEKDAATKDIGDVGQAFGPTAVEMDVVQPYKASTWDSIPDWAKDPDGKWCISYVGTMSAMVNADRVSTTIDSWQALKDSGATITIGDVVRGASAQMAVLSCAYALGGGMDSGPHLRHGEDTLGKGIKALLRHGPDLRGHALHGGPTGNQAVGAFLALPLLIVFLPLLQPLYPVPVLLQLGLVLGVLPPKLV